MCNNCKCGENQCLGYEVYFQFDRDDPVLIGEGGPNFMLDICYREEENENGEEDNYVEFCHGGKTFKLFMRKKK